MPSPATLDLLRLIEANTARAISIDRHTATIGPFLASAHPTNDLVWLSSALPLSAHRDEPFDWPRVVTELRAWFRSHNRRMRFEILEPLWPELAPLLTGQGVELQGRMPLMLCAPADLRAAPIPTGVTIEPVTADSPFEQIRDLVQTANRSFNDGPETTDRHVHEHRAALARGQYRCVVARVDGQPAGAGSMTVENDELVGIGTLPAFRRRGIAAAVSHHLVADHFARGHALAWLSAGDQVARAVYETIGFHVVGDQVNLMDPE
ncbi:MAG: GNAT family N-acetyltransferase [Phycisphaerae bacterium]|nr:GNAT family N-acetyltransferase [Tepidisphaeraceae bacterium]